MRLLAWVALLGGWICGTCVFALQALSQANVEISTTHVQGTPAAVGVAWADLPDAVQRALNAQAGSSSLTSVEKHMIEGQTVYRTVVTRENRPTEILVLPDGSTFSPRNQIAWNQLPTAVQNSFMSINNVSTVRGVTMQTVNGQPIYDFAINDNGRLSRMQFATDGTIVGVQNETVTGQRTPAGFVGTGAVIEESAGAARATEVTFSQLPVAVQNTVKDASGVVPIEGITQQIVNGRTVYEVRFKKNGTPVAMCVSEDGSVVR